VLFSSSDKSASDGQHHPHAKLTAHFSKFPYGKLRWHLIGRTLIEGSTEAFLD
jgi:hypothetical protein